MWKLTVTLADGTIYEFTVPRLPRHWKSYAMDQCPYLTNFRGCTIAREKI